MQPTSNTKRARILRTCVAAIALSGVFAVQTACNNGTEGAVSGTVLGGLAGLGIGSLTGSAGKGAAIGAIAGGIGGAVLGDQNDRKDNRPRRDDDY